MPPPVRRVHRGASSLLAPGRRRVHDAGVRDFLRLLLSQPRKLAVRSVRETVRAATDDHAILALWWNEVPNWGDIVNPVLIEHLSGRPVIRAQAVFNVRRRTTYT